MAGNYTVREVASAGGVRHTLLEPACYITARKAGHALEADGDSATALYAQPPRTRLGIWLAGNVSGLSYHAAC